LPIHTKYTACKWTEKGERNPNIKETLKNRLQETPAPSRAEFSLCAPTGILFGTFAKVLNQNNLMIIFAFTRSQCLIRKTFFSLSLSLSLFLPFAGNAAVWTDFNYSTEFVDSFEAPVKA